MLSDKINNLINEVIKLYSTHPLSQDVIDKGIGQESGIQNRNADDNL